ncbi:SRPBCC domain-containing protein [Dictyobacter aurantiacus]|uniref:Activator of Hsp90 ATPase homologue 1/2-like C-terminal domain-containing protein n=1 Tax=Dictyobacter aurantiacus TaxID=1936993 RepID=A0A401ZJ34_9CHLR|nr:SRPBCC domain-containing protein [Dictyobacter aurantiacus]GCE06865.1 hypothetical protein KDAU_41940 [Dictyobacter aurantiacus]
MATRTTTSKNTINASTDRVWAAITQPELVKQWQYGTDLITDWHVGSPIIFHNEWEGKVFEQKGTVLEIEPTRRVKYSLFFLHPGMEDRPENYFTMTYRLDEIGDQMTLTIIQDDPREQASQERTESQQAAEESENSVLIALKKLVEG